MPDGEVVADSTVLIFLGKLRSLEYLTDTYSSVLIPEEVYEEVVERGKEIGAQDAIRVETAIDATEITVAEAEIHEDIAKHDLEAGETAVLSLALARDHEVVLVDEESVREVARLHDLTPRGTLYFLFAAVKRRELDFEGFLEHVESLLESGFYLDEAVYLEAVRTARQLTTDESSS